jgi:hypothetical protein
MVSRPRDRMTAASSRTWVSTSIMLRHLLPCSGRRPELLVIRDPHSEPPG